MRILPTDNLKWEPSCSNKRYTTVQGNIMMLPCCRGQHHDVAPLQSDT